MTVPAAGWYADPGGAGDERFWDGRQWTGQTRPPRLVSDWRGWLARSGKALTVGRLVAGLASLGATVALAIGLTALIRGEPTRGIGVLLVFAVPVVFVGQIWLIVLGRARMPSGRGWRGRSRMFGVRDARALFFGSLSWATAGPLLVLAFLGWLSAMTAFPSIANGGPTSPSSSCRYRLDSHGATSCVSREIYEHAGAGEQRFAAGILLAFFALHAGGALGGLAERKATVGDRGQVQLVTDRNRPYRLPKGGLSIRPEAGTFWNMGFRNWAYPLDCRVMNRQSAWWDKSALLSRYGGAWTSKTLDEDIDELRQRVARLEARLDQRDDSGQVQICR